MEKRAVAGSLNCQYSRWIEHVTEDGERAMRWKVEVRAEHTFDLADLRLAAGGLKARTATDGDKTFLLAEAFEQMDTATDVYDAAEKLIGTANLNLQLADRGADPITVEAVVGGDGSVSRFTRATGAASVEPAQARFL